MSAFLQDFRYVILILAIFVYAVIFMYRFQRKQAYDNSISYLLASEGYEAYCQRLYSKTGRKIYLEYELKLKQLKAAVDFGKREDARALIKELSSTPMKERDYIAYNKEVLSFAVQEKDAAMAEDVCSAFKKYRRHAKYAQDALQVKDVFILHKSNHIEELIAAAEKTKIPSEKATAYFRIAKQYHYLDEHERCQQYLEMAYTAFPDSTWQKLIKGILDGNYEQLD
nr:hypothetical protein [uncultured Oscillibacter sp.]